MSKSLSFRAFVLCIVTLIGGVAISAHSRVTAAPSPSETLAAFNGTAISADLELMVSASSLPTLGTGQGSLIWNNDKNDEKRDRRDGDDHHKDHDGKNGDKDDHAPAPVPEPPTVLSFGAALAIGAGVFYLRRWRGERK